MPEKAGFLRPLSARDRLTIESSKPKFHQYLGDGMFRLPAKRGVFVRAVCVLCVALVCVIGSLQATHSHPQTSTASHHTCSICATAHVGIVTQTTASVPVLATARWASSITQDSLTFRPTAAQFIRPPPEF